ncbi:MAG TPA: hypothetical protein DEF72_06685 [Gammaproteobacteria bacterium]|nr:hypothetical protein [Gammaproteobacteria bacterium]
MATQHRLLIGVIGSLALGGCSTLDKVKSEWDALVMGDTATTEEKRVAFADSLEKKSLIELCLAHDKEMRWGYLSRRDYVFIEISKEMKRRGEDPLVCRKTSEHGR